MLLTSDERRATNHKNNFLYARDVYKRYKTPERMLPVLNGVNLTIEKGGMVAILGASGAGKSTLLHILGMLDTPTSGSVIYRGINVNELSPKEQAKIRNKSFGFVFQFYHLLSDFNTLENVLIPRLIGQGFFQWGSVKKEYGEKAFELLKRVGLGDRVMHKPDQLSGGERQRAAITRALINDPEVLFCDEPTGNLDTVTGEGILELLCELNKSQNQTTVIVTHDERIAKRAKRVVKIIDGKIVE